MARNKKTGENEKNAWDEVAKNAKKEIEIETKSDKETKKATENNANQSGQDKASDSAASAKTKDSEKAGAEANSELKALQETLAAEKDKYLRLAAEYDNFRKRSIKERETAHSNTKADTVAKLLPVYDNLERALKMECSDEAFYKGIEMIMQQLTELLKNMGISPIPTVGEPFDPNLHDAVLRIENPELGEGIIAEECQKGFALGERIVRHSKVIVAN